MNLNREQKQQIIRQVVQHAPAVESLSGEELRGIIAYVISEGKLPAELSFANKLQLVGQLYDSMRGLDVLQPLVRNNEITEIMVNGPDNVFYEKGGTLYRANIKFDNADHLREVISRYFGRANRIINEQRPIGDMRLEDGSRVHAVLPPIAPDGPVLSIRRFTGIKPDMTGLVESKMLSQEAADYLHRAVIDKKNIFISGGTGTGKTTFLNALSAYIPANERVVTIEDSAELKLSTLDNTVRLEARLPGPDKKGNITLSDLIKSSLRLRPDRIIVGEVRGAEAYDMLQAMQTGHPGSMSTGHGNSPEDMLERLSLLLLSAAQVPWEACHLMLGSTIDILIHLERSRQGKRRVQSILELHGYKDNSYKLVEKFHFTEIQR